MPTPSTPLARLTSLAASLTAELAHMPDLQSAAETLSREHAQAIAQRLQTDIDRYWAAPSAQGGDRRSMFVAAMQQCLVDEVLLKIEDRQLHSVYSRCLPSNEISDVQPQITFHSLHLSFNDTTSAEISGALVINAGPDITLLSLPGHGVEGFTTQRSMFEALTPLINDRALRNRLLGNAEQCYQDLLEDIDADPDLYFAPFQTSHWRVSPVTEAPFAHAFDRQLHKQRKDIAYAFAEGLERSADEHQWPLMIHRAIHMPDLLGPQAMLGSREITQKEQNLRAGLPDWFRFAPATERQRYLESLQRYEESRSALHSVMGDATSPEHFANVRLRARIGNDLGYDLNPEHLLVSTWRKLPLTRQPYKVTRPLNQLALYGLHSEDLLPGSDFRRWSTLSLQGQPLGSAYPELTNDYLVALIEELELRVGFAPVQRLAYAAPQVRQLMQDVTRRQVKAFAYAAKLQGHIADQDLQLIEAISTQSAGSVEHPTRVQQIKLNSTDALSNLLLFRKDDNLGNVERLVLFMPENPRGRQFIGFNNELQLHEELVSWSFFPDLSDYLLNQVALGRRTELQKQLYSLSQKPQPPADFVTLVDLASYEAGLQAFVAEHIRVTLSEQVLHTPNWYLRASPAQRSELIQLEDATSAALKHYQSAPHAQVQSFEDYVHQRAREKINHLLGNPTVAVNPDSILIRSPRQTLTYTQLLRNGYDHSFNPINGSIATDATFSGPPGIDLSALTAQTVARSAHGTWLSDEYIARLRTTLLNANSTGYTYRRRASLLITQLQMKAAALRSRLKGDLSAAQLQWLTASIEQMHVSDSLTRQRYPIYPLQFRLDNAFIASDLPQLDVLLDFVTDDLHVPIDLNSVETVQGCYVLTRANVREPRHALLYTPQAPDGVEFRVFEHFADSLKREGMSDYYKDRCRLKANRTLAFFLIDIKKGGGSQPPVLPQAPFADLYTICFNRGIERKIRDVEETTTGRSDMLNTLIWDSIELIATVLTMPFPPASFAVGALLAFRDSARALMAFSEGDREAASGFILSSLLNSFGAAGDLQSGVKGFGEILRSITVNQGQNPSLVAAKQLQQLAPPTSELSPLTLHGEPFWAGKSNNSGHVALFRSSAQEPDKLIATGQFAQHDADKVLQPLRREISQPLLTNGLSPNPEYAVNISLKGRIPAASGHTKGVVRIDGKDYIELDGLTYQIQYEARMNYWNIIDPANPYAFFGKQPVRFNEQGQWQLLDRLNLRGGQPGRFHELVEEAAGSDTALANTSDYELPAMFQPYLFGVANPAGTSHLTEMDMGIGEVFAELFRSGRKTYGTLRQNLYRDAAAFFQNPRLAAKPELPILDQAASTETLLNSVFEKTNGLVISEAPTSVASKRLLIENMRLLAKAKVEILYVEHLLTDIHMPKLNKYRKLGIRARAGSSQLKFHLSQVNDGALNNQSTYDYYHVVKAAHQQGIEVRPFNSSVSYDFAQNPVPTAAGDDLAAQKMSTFFGSKVIDGDVAEKPARRWVALLDQRLATSHRGLPGIAELQGAISVRVKDIASDQPSRIARDLGSARSNMPRGDFRLEMANPYINEAAPATSKTEALDAALFNLLENPRQASSSVAPLSPHQYMGDQGFHWDDVVGWQRADAEGWSTVDQPTALQQSLADSRYELPLELRSTLHELEYFHLRGLNSEYRFSEPDLSRARDEFFNLRADLQRDARSILSETLSVRVTLPAIDPDAPLPAFLDSLYAHSSGVVIGEAHSCIASKKLIIDNLPHLAQSNVKTLYMEHLLTDLHQIDLDCFMETGQMSKRLLHDLRKLDRGHHTDPKGLYTFEQLIIHARKNAVEVRAIDCAASYFLKQMPTASTTTRQQMMNYFASRTLRKHQQVMGEHKWIALVGNTHANTFQGVPGLAELEQSIGVRVIDVRPGQAKPLAQDPGEQVTKTLNSQSAFLKNDFRLEMETLEAQPAAPSRNASLPTPTPGPLPPEVRVFSPGMFVIDDADPGRMAIVHRSRNNVVHRTPITRNWEGKLLVERESWSTVHQRPFDDLAALIEALKQMKLTHLR